KLAVLEPESYENGGKEKPAEDYIEEIKQLLTRMNEAAEEMDIDSLDAIGKELRQYRFSDDRQEIIEKIQKAIVEFDVDYLRLSSI
ncbi:MAG: hypothetical protein IJ029_06180, partial [Lachnospiraceae bacterium]|nr:hypothetical protein [Lachnospiraceae bacterium]